MTNAELEGRVRALQAMMLVSVHGAGSAQAGAFKTKIGVLRASAIETGDDAEIATYEDMLDAIDAITAGPLATAKTG